MEYLGEGLAAQLRNLVIESDSSEPSRDARPQPRANASFVSNSAPQDLANFLFHAPAVTTREALKLLFDILVESANDHLSHTITIALSWQRFR